MDHLEFVTRAAAEHAARAPRYAMFRDYRDGIHRLDFASPKFRALYAWIVRMSQENLCEAVVDAYTNMLAITSWSASEADAENALDEGLQRLAALVHGEAHTTGNAFTITWNRPGSVEPMAIFHKADQVVPFIDDDQPDRLLAGVKLWIDPASGFGRANVYDDARLTRWVTGSKMTHAPTDPAGMTVPPKFLDRPQAWQPYESDRAPHDEPHAFGVTPVVWWKRKAPSQFEPGRSVLVPAIPVQDELNKMVADAIVASERIAMPLRYVMDVAPELLQPKLNPKTGRMDPPKLPFDESLNSILALTAKGPAGQFPGPDADKIITLQTHAEQKMARTTGIPIFWLSPTSGDVPSGQALRVLSTRLTSQVEAFQRDSTPAWKGQAELLGMRDPAITWAPPLPVSEEERLANAREAKDLGLPAEEWLRIAGFDPYAVDEDGLTLLDRVSATATITAEATARAFLNGDAPNDFGG